MSALEKRITDLEIKYTHQSDLVEELSAELYKANEHIELLGQRIKRMERMSMELLNREELPPNEKPPHY